VSFLSDFALQNSPDVLHLLLFDFQNSPDVSVLSVFGCFIKDNRILVNKKYPLNFWIKWGYFC